MSVKVDHQALFRSYTETAVKEVQTLLKSAKSLNLEVFLDLLRQLGELRKQLATEKGRKNAQAFGSLRYLGRDLVPMMYTCLDHQYEDYGRQLLDRIANALKNLPHSSYGFEKHNKTFCEKSRDRISKCEIEILEASELQKRNWHRNPTLAEFKQVLGDKACADVIESLTLMQEVKQKDLQLYKRALMRCLFSDLHERYPRPQNRLRFDPLHGNLRTTYILGTIRREVSKKLYAQQQFLTWMLYTQDGEDPLERMKKHSKVTIIHQDHFLLEPMLKEITTLFEKAVKWTPDLGEKELKDRVAEFRYHLAVSVPFERGSAAIAEWIEEGIYRFHGYNFEHANKYKADLEAMTALTFSTYLESYPQTIQLEKNEEGSEVKNSHLK